MSFKNIDTESAMRRLADRRIEEAMREGKFDNLPGAGKPLDLEPLPADENARMMWWALKLMRQNDFTPDEVRWRKQLDGLRDQLAAAATEPRVRALVAAINALVRQLNTLGTNAIKTAVVGASLDVELRKLAERQQPPAAAEAAAERRCPNRACEAANDPLARFCAQCGRPLSA